MFKPHLPITVVDNDQQKLRSSSRISKADVRAIRNCWKGEASEADQRRAMAAIIMSIGAADELDYIPGGEDAARASTFLAGRRFVGLEIRKFALQGNLYLVQKEEKPEKKRP